MKKPFALCNYPCELNVVRRFRLEGAETAHNLEELFLKAVARKCLDNLFVLVDSD